MLSRLALLALPAIAHAADVHYYWNISYAIANPDGLQERVVAGVNGSWPPLPLYATQGDNMIIHAYNGLGDIPASVHTHGMFQNGTNYMDGPVGVTQCGIPPGETLVYNISTALQTGTYWAHGHNNGLYVDGLRTPFIIEPKNGTGRSDNTTWDEEYTVIVSDWYHERHDILLMRDFLSWTNPTGAEPVPESALIYVAQKDQYLHSQAELANGTGISNAIQNGAVIPFEAGKKYKIRVINMSALAMFHLSIDQHDMSIIEMDGVELEPYPVDLLSVAVAQRYSILVEAKNETNANFNMLVAQDAAMYDALPDGIVLNNTITIQYAEGNPEPTVIPEHQAINEDGDWPMFDETPLVPVLKKPMAPADVEYVLEFNFDTYDDGTNRASFNTSTYRPPKVPAMFTAMSLGNDSFNPAVYGQQTNAMVYEHMQNIQLTIYNRDAGSHPMHLHGHEFQVVNKAMDSESDDPMENPPLVEGQENPVRRDTIVVPAGGSTTLRWRADNPGTWFFHCHIDWHLSSGLALVFVEAPDKMQETQTVPQVFHDQCQMLGLPSTGNAMGRSGPEVLDLKGQVLGPYPLVMGWTPKAIGALAGCIITALLGFATVVWYGWGGVDEAEIEEEIRLKQQQKKESGGKFGFVKRALGKKN